MKRIMNLAMRMAGKMPSRTFSKIMKPSSGIMIRAPRFLMVQGQLSSITTTDTTIRITVRDTIILTTLTTDIMAIRDIEPGFTFPLDGVGDIHHSDIMIRFTRYIREVSIMADFIHFMATDTDLTTIYT